MRTLGYDQLKAAGRKVMAKAYLRGKANERDRLRTIPRDPAASAQLSRMASAMIRRNPLRRNEDGTLTVPALMEPSQDI